MSRIPIEQFAQLRSDYDAKQAQAMLDEACDHQLRAFSLAQHMTLAPLPNALSGGLPSMYDASLVDAKKLTLARKYAVMLREQPADRTEAAAKNAKNVRRLAAAQLLQMARDPKSISAVAVGATDALTRAFVHEPRSSAPWAKNVSWSRVKQIIDLLDKSKDSIVVWTGPYRRFMIDLLEREKAVSATMASRYWLKHALANLVRGYKDFRTAAETGVPPAITTAATVAFKVVALAGSVAGPWVQGGVNIAAAVGAAGAGVAARKGGESYGGKRAAKALVAALRTGKESLDEAIAFRALMYKAEPAFFKSSWHFGKALKAFLRLKEYTESPVVAQTRAAKSSPPPSAPALDPQTDSTVVKEVAALKAVIMAPPAFGDEDGQGKRLDAAERLGEIAREGPPGAQPAKDAIRAGITKYQSPGARRRDSEVMPSGGPSRSSPIGDAANFELSDDQDLLEALRDADPGDRGDPGQDTTVSDLRELLFTGPSDEARLNAAAALKELASHPKYAQNVKATLEEALNKPGVKDTPPIKAAVEDALGRSTTFALTHDPNDESKKEVREFKDCDEALACARDLMKFLHHYDKAKSYLFPVLVFLEFIFAKSEGWLEVWERGNSGTKAFADMSGVLKTLGRADHRLCRHPGKIVETGARAKLDKLLTHADLCYRGDDTIKDSVVNLAKDSGVFEGKSKKGSPDRDGYMERRRKRQKFEQDVKVRLTMLKEPPIFDEASGLEQSDQRRFAAAVSLGNMGAPAMAYNKGEVIRVLSDTVENDPSDRVRTAAQEARDGIVADLPNALSTEYSDLFHHHDPSRGSRFARFVAYAGREPDVLTVSKTSDAVGQCVLRLGGTTSKVTSQLESVKDAAKRPFAQKGTLDFRYCSHIFDGHWTHTFKEPDAAPAKHRLALLLNHIYAQTENRASHQSRIKRGAYGLRRWAKDVRWRKIVIGVLVVGASIAIIALTAASGGAAAPILAGGMITVGMVATAAGAGVALGNIIATGVSTTANASMQKSDIDELAASKKEIDKRQFAFSLGREAEDTFRKAISHFLRARKNMRRLASWNSPTKMGGRLVNPEYDADNDLKFTKCRHAAKYAYAGMRFYHHYEKFARYILPCAWFAKFTLEYINRWDRYWDSMAVKFLTRIEETVAKDEAWHNERCGCKGVDPTVNVASKNKLNTIKKALTPSPKPESAYCYGQHVAYMNRLEWEPRRPLFPVLFATRSTLKPELVYGDKHAAWVKEVAAQWRTAVLDRVSDKPPPPGSETPPPLPPRPAPSTGSDAPPPLPPRRAKPDTDTDTPPPLPPRPPPPLPPR